MDNSLSKFMFLLFISLISSFNPKVTCQDIMPPTNVPRPASRVINDPESVWLEFVDLAAKNKPVNLGQGFPDFAASEYLIESLHAASYEPIYNQYTRSFGHPRFVKSLSDYYTKVRNISQLDDPNNQILVSVGAYESLYCAIMAFVEENDEVLIIEPAFDAYKPLVELAKGKAVFVELTSRPNRQVKSSSDFILSMSQLESKVNRRTKMLILNTPNNPMGKVFSYSELEQISEFCIKHNLIVVADEVYEQLYFEGLTEHTSIATLPDMWQRTITIGSAGKTFSVTGWKIGWSFGPSHLIRYLQLIHEKTLYTVATPLQEALARSMERETETVLDEVKSGKKQEIAYWRNLREDLLTKRDFLAKILTKVGFKPILPEAGYFMLADFSSFAEKYGHNNNTNISNYTVEGKPNSDDYKFARWLSTEHKLQVIPGSAFYNTAKAKQSASKLVRFCYIKKQSTLQQVETILQNITRTSKIQPKAKL